MRQVFGEKCTDLFMDLSVNEEGEANIEDVKALAPQTLELIERSGAHIAHGDILKFIDNVDVDDSGTINIYEYVQAMEKVAEGISPLALLQIEKAVGHCTRNLTHVDDKIKVVLKTVTDQDNSMAKTLQRLDDKEGSLYKTQIQMSSNIEKANTNMQQILRQTFQEFTEHEDRVQNALATGISDSMQSHSETLLAQVNDTESLIQLAVAQQTTEMQKLFYQLDCNESRVEVAVSKKVSDVSEEVREVRKCLQSVNDNIKTSGDALHKVVSDGEMLRKALDER